MTGRSRRTVSVPLALVLKVLGLKGEVPVPFSGVSQHKLVNRGHKAGFGHPGSAKVLRDPHQQRL